MSDQLVVHPTSPDLWRHDPPTWHSCWVCGGPTCWIDLDLGYTHPECDAGPGYRTVLGKSEN